MKPSARSTRGKFRFRLIQTKWTSRERERLRRTRLTIGEFLFQFKDSSILLHPLNSMSFDFNLLCTYFSKDGISDTKFLTRYISDFLKFASTKTECFLARFMHYFSSDMITLLTDWRIEDKLQINNAAILTSLQKFFKHQNKVSKRRLLLRRK